LILLAKVVINNNQGGRIDVVGDHLPGQPCRQIGFLWSEQEPRLSDAVRAAFDLWDQ
jgi:hypothetical protein